MKILRFIWELPRNTSILLIRIYQKVLSPDQGLPSHFFSIKFCKYHPTCSTYAIDSLKKYGFIKGWRKTIWRLLRCNPWSKGGIDLP